MTSTLVYLSQNMQTLINYVLHVLTQCWNRHSRESIWSFVFLTEINVCFILKTWLNCEMLFLLNIFLTFSPLTLADVVNLPLRVFSCEKNFLHFSVPSINRVRQFLIMACNQVAIYADPKRMSIFVAQKWNFFKTQFDENNHLKKNIIFLSYEKQKCCLCLTKSENHLLWIFLHLETFLVFKEC